MKKALLVVLLLFLPLSVSAFSFNTADGQFIRLHAATFDPIASGEPAAVREPELAGVVNPYHIVQLSSPSSQAAVAQLEQLGATLLGYLPDNAYIARIGDSALPRVRSLPAVRWVGPYRPAYKRA
ncbi:hypothetical protein HC891_13770, partial [Candidatus Gracilibacteria bacterium]|nr:hypothetical protein [Candidatus Gracilibacteria bacterium]